MLQLPPLLSWDSLHPLIVHFPIVLLLVCPLFVLVGALMSPSKGRSYLVAAFVLLLFGTTSLFLAVQTGEAAGTLSRGNPSVESLLQTHHSLATETRGVFVTLSVIGCGVFFLPCLLRKTDRLLFSRVLPLSFLAFYLVGIIFLVNTADRGGRLVHEFGVHALISPTTEKPAGSPADPTPE